MSDHTATVEADASCRACPMCGGTVPATAAQCPACGETLNVTAESVWVEGSTLIMRRSARLPDRCLKSDATDDIVRVTRKTFKNSIEGVVVAAVLLLLLTALVPPLGVLSLITMGVALYRMKLIAVVELPYSRRWRDRRARARRIAYALVIASLILIGTFSALTYQSGLVRPVPLAMILAAGVLALVGTWISAALWPDCVINWVGDNFVCVSGVSRDYLDRLPSFPRREFEKTVGGRRWWQL